ncbi:Protein BATH-38 [Aphelenchoides avenae]|nr:Protein BATH-38 [Aphelenchus avenae]
MSSSDAAKSYAEAVKSPQQKSPEQAIQGAPSDDGGRSAVPAHLTPPPNTAEHQPSISRHPHRENHAVGTVPNTPEAPTRDTPKRAAAVAALTKLTSRPTTVKQEQVDVEHGRPVAPKRNRLNGSMSYHFKAPVHYCVNGPLVCTLGSSAPRAPEVIPATIPPGVVPVHSGLDTATHVPNATHAAEAHVVTPAPTATSSSSDGVHTSSQKNPEPVERKRLRSSLVNSAAQTDSTSPPLTTVTAQATDDPELAQTISLRIPGITAFTTQLDRHARSDVVQCGGIGWHAFVQPFKANGRHFVSCFLIGNARGTWSAWVNVRYSILGPGADFAPRGFDYLYGSDPLVNNWGHKKFIVRETLLAPENELVSNDDSIEFRVHIAVSNVRGAAFFVFDTEDSLPSDVKLVVEGDTFYANKGYLSVVSLFFRKQFSSVWHGSGMQELTLHDVEAEDFKQFLMAIHPMRLPISDSNAISLYRLADYFGVKPLFAECEAYLKNAKTVPAIDRLIVAQQLERNDLKEGVISRLTDDDVKAIAGDPRSEELAKQTLLKVLKTSVLLDSSKLHH